MRRLAVGALCLAVLIGGCATGPSTRRPDRIRSDGAAHLRRAAENIELAISDWDRAVEHWGRSLTLAEEAWPELHAELQKLAADVAVATENDDDALLRKLAGTLREIADGAAPLPPQDWFIELAAIFRDLAAMARRSVQITAPSLENIRDGENDGEAGDRAVDELMQAADAMKAAATHYDAAADGIARASADKHRNR